MIKKQEKTKNYNLILYIIAISLIFLVFAARIFQLTVVKKSNSVDLSQLDPIYENGSSITQVRRGNIFDSSGKPIALDTTSYSLYAQIKGENDVVEDPDETAKFLSNVLNVSRDEILGYLLQDNLNQVEFGPAGKDLNQEQILAISQANFPGLHIHEEVSRFYANDFYASHLIGYADKSEDGSKMEGKLGIELAFNDQLSQASQRDSQGLQSGSDLYLTLDSRLQNYLDSLLADSYQKYQPEEMGAYLVDVKSGRLLASSQQPSFNLNTREGIEKEWMNLLVENSYEPGSTIKILVSALAQDLHLYQPGETYQSGSIEVYDRKIHDYNLEGWGEISFDEGLIRSSNVGMVELVQRMGLDTWMKKLEEFGFGQTTQSGLPNETKGQIAFDNPVSQTMSAFGQGIMTSPIQLLQAYSSIGNGGKMMKIQYLDHMTGSGPSKFEPIVVKNLFTPQAANKVLSLMVDTVEKDYGTAKDYRMEGVKIAAKTGTAQIADPNGNGYLTGPSDYYFSVVSFFPADDPNYILYMSMKRPSQAQGRTGNQILSEIFKPFVNYVLVD